MQWDTSQGGALLWAKLTAQWTVKLWMESNKFFLEIGKKLFRKQSLKSLWGLHRISSVSLSIFSYLNSEFIVSIIDVVLRIPRPCSLKLFHKTLLKNKPRRVFGIFIRGILKNNKILEHFSMPFRFYAAFRLGFKQRSLYTYLLWGYARYTACCCCRCSCQRPEIPRGEVESDYCTEGGTISGFNTFTGIRKHQKNLSFSRLLCWHWVLLCCFNTFRDFYIYDFLLAHKQLSFLVLKKLKKHCTR